MGVDKTDSTAYCMHAGVNHRYTSYSMKSQRSWENWLSLSCFITSIIMRRKQAIFGGTIIMTYSACII